MTLKHFLYTALLIISLVCIFLIQGCGTKSKEFVETLREDTFTQGCVGLVEKANAIGYFTASNAGIEVCKVKCSDELPEGYKFRYEEPRIGCSASVGYTEEELQKPKK